MKIAKLYRYARRSCRSEIEEWARVCIEHRGRSIDRCLDEDYVVASVRTVLSNYAKRGVEPYYTIKRLLLADHSTEILVMVIRNVLRGYSRVARAEA